MRAALERGRVPADAVGEVYLGCVLPAGIGQAPARQAAIAAGIPPAVGAVTINKVCGSGLKAVVFGANAIAAGEHDVVVAGGMESMSNAPYLLPKAREGYRLGHAQVIDSLVHDGLWDAYGNFHMGNSAELCAKEKGITRAEQDAFAVESYKRALRAQAEGTFHAEIVPVEVAQKKGAPKIVANDEEPGRGDIEKLATLQPAFQKDGTVTAGNASSINDGAAALVLAAADVAKRAAASRWPASSAQRGGAGARVVHHRAGGRDRRLLARWAGRRTTSTSSRSTRPSRSWRSPTTGCWASIPSGSTSAAARSRSATRSAPRALACWSPCSTRCRRRKRRGVASLCIGGGEGIAMAVELI